MITRNNITKRMQELIQNGGTPSSATNLYVRGLILGIGNSPGIVSDLDNCIRKKWGHTVLEAIKHRAWEKLS